MSWWGGGEISPTPAVECRVRAIQGYILAGGSWPPSPGFAPCAILIWMSSACVRYMLVTPNRPDATCLIRLRRSGSSSRSPPSPPSPPHPGMDRGPELVHGDRQRLVRLLGDGAGGHRARVEAGHDRLDRLDLV